VADRFGWRFDTKVDWTLPSDPDVLESLLNDFAANPPVALKREMPYAFAAGAIERVEANAGASVAFEYASDFRDWIPAGLSDEQQRAIQDGMDEWLRTELAPRFGVLVTDVRRGRGGWINEGEFTDTINSVYDVAGSREQVRAFAAALGHNLKQWAVFASRPKEGIHNLARYDAGEAWALSFVAKTPITDEQAVALQRAIAAGSPDIGGWGSSIVRTADGRIAVRYLDTAREGAVSSEQFLADTRPFLGESLNDALDGLDFDVAIHHDVMEWDRPFNDWEAQPNGEAYKGIVAESRPDVAGDLESRYASEGQDRLAALLRLHAPNEFADHLDGLRAAGKPIPEFRVPGEFVPAPLSDRVAVFIPGGRDSLRQADREFTLWEQQQIKAQQIDPEALYNADPDLYVDLMDAIWRSKVKTSMDPPQRYNAMAWAALTANSPLDVTEGAFALWRANVSPSAAGVERLTVRAIRIANTLPERFRSDESALGIAFQLDEGMRFSGYDLIRADWLTPEERTTLDALITRIDRRLSGMTDERREVWARRLQARIDQQGRHRNVRLQVHPFPTKDISDQFTGTMRSYVSISRPGVRIKGSATNTSWGRIIKWLSSGLWNSDAPGVQRFLNIQAGESRTDWALRLSSVLPGIDVKTALLAAEGSAPHLATHGAMDTHMIRYIVQRANARGELQGLLSAVSPGYAKHLDEQLRRSMDGRSAFKSPQSDRVNLVSSSWLNKPWSPEKLAHMRSRLHLIPDPEVRALYNDDEVLRFASETGGKVNLWGGDYAAIEEYFSTTLRADEVARLRAAGHTRAADRIEAMSGGEWQWLMWDRIRASAGLRLDPHNSLTRSAGAMQPRSSLELDRAMEIGRSGGPFDPQYSMLLQEEDGRILGANAIMADDRRILLATEHADARTGLHEMAHAFEPDLDPSQRNIILDAFRTASGSKRTTWSREVSEWWADEFLTYVKGGSKVAPGNLRSSFEYFRKTVGGVEATIKARAERQVLEATRKTAVARAAKATAKTVPARREAEQALNAARRAEKQARRELRRARQRVDLDTLEGRWNAAKQEVERLGETLKEAKARVRAATAEARAARTRAREAAGTRSAGGLTAAIRRKEEAITRAEQAVKQTERAVARARRDSARHAADVRGARRRTPLKQYEDRVAAAQKATGKAGDKASIATEADKAAQKALQDARDLPVRPKKASVAAPEVSPEMRALMDEILNPPDRTVTKTGPGSPVDIGTHYDLQEEAAYEAAHIALSRAEEDAFTLHYYKRGRSFVERSLNHPYFGLYPASYMWGKVLPELLRFLVKTPFGIEAPLGGLALSNNIYRQVMVQQQYDPEFRQQMIDRTDMFHLLALMTPALPWEIPVNAPLWARRVAEADATHQAELASGDASSPMMDPEQFGKLTQEMLGYAFGPANAAEMVGSGVNSLFNLGDETFRAAAQTVQGVLAQGQGMPAPPPLTTPGAPNVDTAP
jgi:hypothetical protein